MNCVSSFVENLAENFVVKTQERKKLWKYQLDLENHKH